MPWHALARPARWSGEAPSTGCRPRGPPRAPARFLHRRSRLRGEFLSPWPRLLGFRRCPQDQFHPRTQVSASPGPRVPPRRAHRAPKPPVATGQLEARSTSRPPSREVGEAAAEEAVAPRSRPTSDNSRSPDEAGQAGEEVVTGASSPGSRHAPPAGLRCLRLDVLVHAEKVPRVVFTL